MSSPNASTTSLPGLAKQAQQQQQQQQPLGFRKAINMPPPHWVKEPMAVLEGVLGVPVRQPATEGQPDGKAGGPDDSTLELPELEDADTVDFEGLSLDEYISRPEPVELRVEKTPEECRLPSEF